eukprot:11298697-Alexandrium_andersonii.AAC.1
MPARPEWPERSTWPECVTRLGRLRGAFVGPLKFALASGVSRVPRAVQNHSWAELAASVEPAPQPARRGVGRGDS